MRGLALRVLGAFLAVLLAPVAANATTYLTDVGSAYSGSVNSLSMSTTGAVPGGGRLIVVAATTGVPSTPTGMTGCALDGVTPSQVRSTLSLYIFSWTCSGGLASGTSITVPIDTTGPQMLWMFSTPNTVTTQDATGSDLSGSPDTSPTLVTGSFVNNPAVLIEATFLLGAQVVETTSTGCTSHGDTPNGPPSVNDLWVSECPVSATGPYTYTSTFAASRNWIVAGGGFKIGAVATPSAHTLTTTGAGN